MARITKTEGKAQWKREFEWTSTTLTRCANGKWRVTEEAEGWNGGRPGVPDTTRFVDDEEAVTMLIDVFCCDDHEIAAIRSLKDYAPADLPD